MYIAQDIVDEILLRLPVKSLTRFQGVCKSWYLNIHSESFIAKHIENQKTSEKILIYYRNHYRGNNFAVSMCSEQEKEDLDDDNSQQYFVNYMPSEYMNFPVNVIGTCNGIVCLHYTDARRITLWNPATRDLKILPPGAQKSGADHVGFGFDIANNDYKVIRISYIQEEKRRYTKLEEHIIQLQIYSLNSNSWREFDCYGLSTQIITPPGYSGTLCGKEKYCWMARKVNKPEIKLILSFDMGKEVFQKTPLPSDFVNFGPTPSVERLFPFHDSIALVQYSERFMKTFSIWTTKQLEGESTSWIKISNIGPLSKILNPLGFWKCKYSNNYLFLLFHDEYGKPPIVPPPVDWLKGICMNQGEIKNERLMTIKVKVKNTNAYPWRILNFTETLVSVNRRP